MGGATVLQDDILIELAMTSPMGVFIAATHVGHLVYRDDPVLVVHLVQHFQAAAFGGPKVAPRTRIGP
jgi:hypothetical protein